MQKLWVNRFAEDAVANFQMTLRHSTELPPVDVQETLIREIVARAPQRWVACSPNGYEHRLLWKSVHRLGMKACPLAIQSQSSELWGILQSETDWAALQTEIRTKTLRCLRTLDNSVSVANAPTGYCCKCNEYVFEESGQTCACDANINDAHRCHSMWWRYRYCGRNFLVRGDAYVRHAPDDPSWQDVRTFLSFFVEWISHHEVFEKRMVFAKVDGNSLIFNLDEREHAWLLLGDSKLTLYLRSLRRLVQTNARGGCALLADSLHQDQFHLVSLKEM